MISLIIQGMFVSQLATHLAAQPRSQGRPSADPVATACKQGASDGSTVVDPKKAWQEGKRLENIEGDAPFGMNWGHTEEALGWYCKAAAGSAVAPYEIGRIFQEGYAVNLVVGGSTQTRFVSADPVVAFYWHRVAATRGFTPAMEAMSHFYSEGPRWPGSVAPEDLSEAKRWLLLAAKQGDSDVLEGIAKRALGIPVAPWLSRIPLTPDDIDDALSHWSLVLAAAHHCTDPDNVREMKARLPSPGEAADVRGETMLWASGDDQAMLAGPASRAFQVRCALSLSGPPAAKEQEPLLEQMDRFLHGGSQKTWTYTLTWHPGDGRPVIVGQTRGEALEGIMENIAILTRATLFVESRLHPRTASAPGNPISGKWHCIHDIDIAPSDKPALHLPNVARDVVATAYADGTVEMQDTVDHSCPATRWAVHGAAATPMDLDRPCFKNDGSTSMLTGGSATVSPDQWNQSLAVSYRSMNGHGTVAVTSRCTR